MSGNAFYQFSRKNMKLEITKLFMADNVFKTIFELTKLQKYFIFSRFLISKILTVHIIFLLYNMVWFEPHDIFPPPSNFCPIAVVWKESDLACWSKWTDNESLMECSKKI